jgi:hypothetical protein
VIAVLVTVILGARPPAVFGSSTARPPLSRAETAWLDEARREQQRLWKAVVVLNGLTLDGRWWVAAGQGGGPVELRFRPTVFEQRSHDRAVFDLVASTFLSCKTDLPAAPTSRLRPTRMLLVEACTYLSRGIATIRDKVIASSSDGGIPWKLRRRAAGWIDYGGGELEQAGAALS